MCYPHAHIRSIACIRIYLPSMQYPHNIMNVCIRIRDTPIRAYTFYVPCTKLGGQEACDRFLDVQISPIVKVMSSNCPPAAGSSQESQLQVASPVFWGNLMRTAGIMVDPKEAKTHSPPPFAGSASYPSAASPSVSSSPPLNYKGLLQERLCRAGNSSGINPKYIHDSGEFNEQTQMW